jgi:RNA polymerase sigma-70 factor (ECF subfamily)
VLLTPAPELAARLRIYVRRRVADPHAADDVLQEVLLRVAARGGSLRDPGALEGWAHRVAANAIVDHRRARPPELPTDDPRILDRPVDDEGDDDGAVLARLARCLPSLVTRLPPVDRQALELCDLGGLTQAEAAARLGLTVPGMKARVQRARRRLRDLVLRCCDVALDARHRVVAYAPPGDCACERA